MRNQVLAFAILLIVLPAGSSAVQAELVQLVEDLVPGTNGSYPEQLVANGEILYFEATDVISSRGQIFRSDGTESGTYPITDLTGAGPYHLTLVGDMLYFIMSIGVDHELWKSDGTVGGEEMVADVWLQVNRPEYLIGVGDLLFFSADDGSGTTGRELWMSDGTTAGTVMVKDCYPGSTASSPEYLFSMGSLCFFLATDPVGGREMWRSDGTEAGTYMPVDVVPGLTTGNFECPCEMNGILYYKAGLQLWRSDGSVGGTWEVYSPATGALNPSELTVMNDILYFYGRAIDLGNELWRSDGTTLGTYLVCDIYPGAQSGWPWFLTTAGNTLVFRAQDPTYGNELWKSDGTGPGTALVKDFTAGSSGSFPTDFITFLDRVYFKVNDGVHGTELWVTDGTAAGTELTVDLVPGTGTGNPQELTVAGSKLFFAATVSPYGRELFVLYSTVEGDLTCAPSSGILPFASQFTAGLHNRYLLQTRKIKGVIDVQLANGNSYPNWRSGDTNVAAGSSFTTSFSVDFPSYGSLVGDNSFTLTVADVTPPPYNQPPYVPAGDTDMAAAIVTCTAP